MERNSFKLLDREREFTRNAFERGISKFIELESDNLSNGRMSGSRSSSDSHRNSNSSSIGSLKWIKNSECKWIPACEPELSSSKSENPGKRSCLVYLSRTSLGNNDENNNEDTIVASSKEHREYTTSEEDLIQAQLNNAKREDESNWSQNNEETNQQIQNDEASIDGSIEDQSDENDEDYDQR